MASAVALIENGVILNFSEESPTRRHPVSALSLVGYEEILRFTQNDLFADKFYKTRVKCSLPYYFNLSLFTL